MPKLTIDGQEVEVESGATVLQACEQAGVEVPRFCYHDRLSIAGNCRMCLVQIEGGPPKPAASCAMPAGEGMVVHTNSPMVKQAREGVMEFLLINHPLDCPICDQGGECDLQDQAMSYGCGESRFDEHKRAVKEKELGPLIKTHMTRCIHCTRCVRFSTEIAGVEEMGGVFRGEHMEIGTYVEKALTSELSGNMIDLCPVGALTSKPYAFRARSWELRKTESIDVLDAVGSNIRVDARGNEVMRILPRLHEDINEEWISDKTRFAYDGLMLQRLDKPMVRKDGKLQPASWHEAMAEVAKHLDGLPAEKFAAIIGDLVDVETMTAFKDLSNSLKLKNIDARQNGTKLDASERSRYLFNTTIAGIEEADFCLLIGSNPRFEAPLVNARLRKRFLKGGFKVVSIGEDADLTYKVENISQTPDILESILKEVHEVSEQLKSAKKPMIIVGQGALARPDGDAILAAAQQIAETFGLISDDWNGFNVLHTAASRVGALDLGLVPGEGDLDVEGILSATEKGDIEVLYLLGADEVDMSRLGSSFVIYQGHHGDAGAHRADVILPGAAYTEKNATYVNTEGRVQRTRRAVSPPGEAIEDWKIISMVADAVEESLSYNTLSGVRKKMQEYGEHFSKLDETLSAKWAPATLTGKITSEPLTSAVQHFYMTDPISRASKTMAECASLVISKNKAEQTKDKAA